MTQYSEIKGMNWSSLRQMDVSPFAFKWYIEHPRKDKSYFALGRLVHLALLQPDLFDEVCVRRPDMWDSWRTKDSKEWKDEQIAKGKEIIDDENARILNAIRGNLSKHQHSDILLNTKREEVLTWHDKGVLCKGRIDAISADKLIEIKTAHNLSKFFRRDFFYHLYHGQIAWYLDGAIENKFCSHQAKVYVICCETNPPYDVAIFELDNSVIIYGRRLKDRLFDTWIACKESQIWPGLYPNITVLETPYWYRSQEEEEEEEIEVLEL